MKIAYVPEIRSEKVTLRVEHNKIHNVSRTVGLIGGCIAGVLYFRIDPFLSPFIAAVSGLVILMITRMTLLKFANGTSFAPNGPYIEAIANRSDEGILIEEFFRMGGKSAAAAASNLENNTDQQSLSLSADNEKVADSLRDFFKKNGVLFTSNPETNSMIKGLIGCGIKQMNPALTTINLCTISEGTQAEIKAIAKEGLVKQKSAEEAVKLVSDYLLTQFKNAR